MNSRERVGWVTCGLLSVVVLILSVYPATGIPAPVFCGNWCAEAYQTRSCAINLDKPFACTAFQFGTCHICPGDGSSNCYSTWYKGQQCLPAESQNLAYDGTYDAGCTCVGFVNKVEPNNCGMLSEPYLDIQRFCKYVAE